MKLCPACKNTYPDDYQTCPRDQAPLTILGMEITPGSILRGKYEVISELGAGGMATVYKVRHKAFHELAAVKVVHAQFMHDPDFVKRFRNEAIVARRLKHPNAVRIDDFDYTDDGRPFIVMEFVDGRSLYDMRRAAPGPWPVDRCVDIISQAAEALGAAHTLGIVHRDIKPANLVLLRGPDDTIHLKVLDFGIAKVSSATPFAGMTSVLTQQSLVIGTPEYMSPEQASGRLETALDGRSDLYSLGLVFYEMLTGTHPFQADTPMGMLIQQLNTAPAPPESVHAVSPAISAIILKTLQKDPAKRFQSTAEMLAALRDPQAWFSQAVTQPFAPVAKPAAPPPSAAKTFIEPPVTPRPTPSPTPSFTSSTEDEPESSPSSFPSFIRQPIVIVGAVLTVLLLVGLIFFFSNSSSKPQPQSASAAPPAQSSAPQVDPEVLTGEAAFAKLGCSTCHTGDASARGPNLAGSYGSHLGLANGSVITIDDTFLKEAILNPSQHLPAGYAPIMPTYQGLATPSDLAALISYIKSDYYKAHPVNTTSVPTNQPQPTDQSARQSAGPQSPRPQASSTTPSASSNVSVAPIPPPVISDKEASARPSGTADAFAPKSADIAHLSSGIAAGNLLFSVQPIYPAIAKAAHIAGSVILHATISKTGNIKDLSVISGPSMLQQSAMEAVKQWKYKPFVLNGRPTEVDTTITVNYQFGPAATPQP